jgi:hypothetical protein
MLKKCETGNRVVTPGFPFQVVSAGKVREQRPEIRDQMSVVREQEGCEASCAARRIYRKGQNTHPDL